MTTSMKQLASDVNGDRMTERRGIRARATHQGRGGAHLLGLREEREGVGCEGERQALQPRPGNKYDGAAAGPWTGCDCEVEKDAATDVTCDDALVAELGVSTWSRTYASAQVSAYYAPLTAAEFRLGEQRGWGLALSHAAACARVFDGGERDDVNPMENKRHQVPER
ncbi:hypothetical protein BV25DRAFT_1843197 [Artomyces pyxidatus]|uniref:Uncharacterized protein n=1 Tax=Artomyces pyxidatus TaxID=48021 RepID=A0ACB8SFV8_9AGAM|nr:hypothetical protein BV25DRAFT_1843197 [Artomyces pyxidatus]